MTGPPGFSGHHRDGDHVVKLLDVPEPASERVAAAAQEGGRTGMQRYLDLLRAHEVTLPPDLNVISDSPLAVRHRWIDGPTLADLAVQHPHQFVAAVAQVAHWVRAVGNTDARIDTNLANFCLTAGGPVLVDVLPPLRLSYLPAPPHTLFETLFCALCFDTEVTLDALIGYAARALLRADPPPQARHALAELGRDLRPSLATNPVGGFPAGWFRARARLALATLTGEVPTPVLHDFFAATSVLAFHELDEVHRELRLHTVDGLITTLDLA
ncbi:MAG: hypothetical protein ACRDRY_12225 [Pseudonocardiaceae bacterium]